LQLKGASLRNRFNLPTGLPPRRRRFGLLTQLIIRSQAVS
jgi:hypothetical protein